MDTKNQITIEGARQHNLKNISLRIPKNSLTVITGLSGSGKSSLAFDTLYAEGQRRYVESLSTYARQFLGKMEKPDVDVIDGLSPAIAIEQKTVSHNPRSTVGTITEIYDFLRLLYARIGKPHCFKCGKPISSETIDQLIEKLTSFEKGTKLILSSPIVTNTKGSHEKALKQLKKDGFARVMIDGKTYLLEDKIILNKAKPHTIDVVIDRLILKDNIRNRLTDSIELAVAQSDGQVKIEVINAKDNTSKIITFNEKAVCLDCNVSYPAFTPADFSFNSPKGACTECDGIGTITEFDESLIIPNPELSLREGAVLPWANRSSVQFFEFIDGLTSFYGTDIFTPYKKLSDDFKKVLMYGSGETEIPFYFEKDDKKIIYSKKYEGIITNLKNKLDETKSKKEKDELKKYLNYMPCPYCKGTRLKPQSSYVTINKKNIADFTAMPVSSSLKFIDEFQYQSGTKDVAGAILHQIKNRLLFLKNVGLSYLSLNRKSYTLSGGENQRIRLATQIGSRLSGVLYVLDEPSIGLHQCDNDKLISTLKGIKEIGNTVLVVEHDEDTIMAADHVIDMGPGAGVNGGEITFQGPPEKLIKSESSLTGAYFSGRKKIEIPSSRRTQKTKFISIYGASENNLKNIDISFPVGCITCVTGVSGSGKSTLVLTTLYNVLAQKLYNAKISAGAYKKITGIENFDKVINIDQSPIGKTPRSNPATYTGIFNNIRELFSHTTDAKTKGYKSGRFSFNTKGGRCEACKGDGINKIEMHFLPDIYVTCDICNGKRYNRETLEVKYKGKNISDVLNMTINQAYLFFKNIASIRSKLETLIEVGMGYAQLGQPATTLSGGEAQRVKIAKELGKKNTGKTVYILDEPTTGLHIDDINKLMTVLNKLVDAGNTIIIIEHNLEVIKCADYIVDLGPDGGDTGGYVVAEGTPEEITFNTNSHTGFYLKKVLNKI